MSRRQRIFLSPPDVGVMEEEAAMRAVQSGWVAPVGPELDAFEAEVASFTGSKHAVALNSGTSAIHLGLLAVGVRPGDSVITSTMTFVATANAIVYTGARPIFVDSLPDGTLDPTLIAEAIKIEITNGRRVGAILPVDIYGKLANYSEIVPLAEKNGIPIVADSAESLGSIHRGLPVGSWGEVAAVSFNGNKIITTSGGGMLLTSNREAAAYVRHLATQARESTVHYEHVHLGYNYRMSNVSAAIGRAQLSRLPAMISARRKRRVQYEHFFSSIGGVRMMPGNIAEDNCWLTSILVDIDLTDWGPLDLLNYLSRQNIESRPLWKPMHLQPLYKGSTFVGGKVAEGLFRDGLALPSGSSMRESDMDRVLDAISNFLQSK